VHSIAQLGIAGAQCVLECSGGHVTRGHFSADMLINIKIRSNINSRLQYLILSNVHLLPEYFFDPIVCGETSSPLFAEAMQLQQSRSCDFLIKLSGVARQKAERLPWIEQEIDI